MIGAPDNIMYKENIVKLISNQEDSLNNNLNNISTYIAG
jgi:hypothetical protein